MPTRRAPVKFAALLILVVGVVAIRPWLDPAEHVAAWRTAAYAFTGAVVTFFAFLGVTYATGITARFPYMRGYRAGRDSMLASLTEAQRRGLTTKDWIAGELLREGIPHTTWVDDDGHVVAIDVTERGTALP